MTRLEEAYILDEYMKFIGFHVRTKGIEVYELHKFLLEINKKMLAVQEAGEL